MVQKYGTNQETVLQMVGSGKPSLAYRTALTIGYFLSLS